MGVCTQPYSGVPPGKADSWLESGSVWAPPRSRSIGDIHIYISHGIYYRESAYSIVGLALQVEIQMILAVMRGCKEAGGTPRTSAEARGSRKLSGGRREERRAIAAPALVWTLSLRAT